MYGMSLLSFPYINPKSVVESTDSDFWGSFQVSSLILFYGYFLSKGCALVSEGAELLLLTPYERVVGCTLLPVMWFSGVGVSWFLERVPADSRRASRRRGRRR